MFERWAQKSEITECIKFAEIWGICKFIIFVKIGGEYAISSIGLLGGMDAPCCSRNHGYVLITTLLNFNTSAGSPSVVTEISGVSTIVYLSVVENWKASELPLLQNRSATTPARLRMLACLPACLPACPPTRLFSAAGPSSVRVLDGVSGQEGVRLCQRHAGRADDKLK